MLIAAPIKLHIDGLVQERRNSSTLAMELRISCTNPSILQHILLKGFDIMMEFVAAIQTWLLGLNFEWILS